MWDESQKQASVSTKRVKSAPKLIKPSAKKPSVRRDKVRQLKNQLKKTGKTADAASLIENLI
jgi:hypothetical protein